jgi:uncharacterized protein
MDAAHLSPNFIIPVGTQVVLKKDIEVAGPASADDDTRRIKKRGSVGVIEQAPLNNAYPYTIRFADGHIVRTKRADLTVRRSDAPEDELPARDIAAYEAHLIYRVRMGSHAFGLSDENSDEDERGIFLPPAEWHWSLQRVPEQIEFKRTADGRIIDHNEKEGEADYCWWELEKLLRLALKANPNILEALYVSEEHILFCSELGWKLRALREKFLSKYVYQTYSGYALSQFRKLKRDVEQGGTYRPKHAMHLIRLFYSGIEALRGKGILVDVGRYRDELLQIKHAPPPFDQLYARALELDRIFQAEYDRTALPEGPDVAAVDQFLIYARRSKVK